VIKVKDENCPSCEEIARGLLPSVFLTQICQKLAKGDSSKLKTCIELTKSFRDRKLSFKEFKNQILDKLKTSDKEILEKFEEIGK